MAGAAPAISARRVDRAAPLIFAALGTHTQAMDSLRRALEEIARRMPRAGPFQIQHGSTPLPEGWSGREYFEPAELSDAIGAADIVITHGGPATIALVRRLGKIPVVIPRTNVRREHVDDHQVLYARRLDLAGEIVLLEDPSTLFSTLNQLGEIVSRLPKPRPHDPTPAVERFAAIVRSLEQRSEA